MNLKLRKIGNSQGFVLPAALLKQFENTAGEWSAEMVDKKIVITPPEPTLEQMVSAMGDKEFGEELSFGEPIGDELI